MFRRNVLGVIVACLAFAAGGAGIHASGGYGRTLVVTMTNDPNANQLRVYDAQSHVLLQTLSTHGKGGVGGNARGIKQHDGRTRRRGQQRIEQRCALQTRWGRAEV